MPPAKREAIAALGPLLEVEPAGRGVDDMPLLGQDQVYAFTTGTVFHTHCFVPPWWQGGTKTRRA
jgi:hypothetical protein